MKKIEVFDGNALSEQPIIYPTENPRCAFIGVDPNGRDVYVPVDANLLSRHMVLLGGIGTGSIGLGGDGRLIDWEIFNRPSKGSINGYSNFAVRAIQDGKITAAVLNGDYIRNYNDFLEYKK